MDSQMISVYSQMYTAEFMGKLKYFEIALY